MGKTGTLERPAYYWSGDVDVIAVIEQYDLGFHIGNALKYVVRAGLKGDAVDDMRKAREYVRRWQTWKQRDPMNGGFGLDWMHPVQVARHFRLTGTRKQIVVALLEAAGNYPEGPSIDKAAGLLDDWLAAGGVEAETVDGGAA